MPNSMYANDIAIPYRGQRYEDEDIAFNKGQESFKKGDAKNPYKDEQFPNPNVIAAWENGYNTAKRQKYLKVNEMADIEKKGLNLYVNKSPVKNLNVEEASNNMIYWRNDKRSVFYDEGYTMIWFIKTDESNAYLREHQDLLLFFPEKQSLNFKPNSGPIHDIWKSNRGIKRNKYTPKLTEYETKVQKDIIGVIEAYTDTNIIYIDMMSVRPGYMKNGINNLMIKYLISQFPNATLKFSDPTKDGKSFINKYYTYAKIEGVMTDDDIADLIDKLKTDYKGFFYTSKDAIIASRKLLTNPPDPNKFMKPSAHARACWEALIQYTKSTV